MKNKFQLFDKTRQRGVLTKSSGTPVQEVEKRYFPGQNGTSGPDVNSGINLFHNGVYLCFLSSDKRFS